jgi:hypothetical protein
MPFQKCKKTQDSVAMTVTQYYHVIEHRDLKREMSSLMSLNAKESMSEQFSGCSHLVKRSTLNSDEISKESGHGIRLPLLLLYNFQAATGLLRCM